jgi:hypothetical protein
VAKRDLWEKTAKVCLLRAFGLFSCKYMHKTISQSKACPYNYKEPAKRISSELACQNFEAISGYVILAK